MLLAIVATYAIMSYSDSVATGKNTAAKTRLEVINGGYERFKMENPSINLTPGPFNNISGVVSCDKDDLSPNRLIHCGYIPRAEYENGDYLYYIRGTFPCGTGLVYMKARTGADVSNKYKVPYCASINNKGEAVDEYIPD